MVGSVGTIQDAFIQFLLTNKVATTVFLVNGVKLQGVITCLDDQSILLRRDGHAQLVYKHAISTIMPNVPVQIFEGMESTFDHTPA